MIKQEAALFKTIMDHVKDCYPEHKDNYQCEIIKINQPHLEYDLTYCVVIKDIGYLIKAFIHATIWKYDVLHYAESLNKETFPNFEKYNFKKMENNIWMY